MTGADTLALCYHNIVPDDMPGDVLEALLAVPRSSFLNHLRYLSANYRILSLEEVEQGGGSRKGLVLTFDDGYRAIITHVLPLIAERPLPIYVFVNPALMGEWSPRDKLMGLALYGSDRARRDVGEFMGGQIDTEDLAQRARRFVALRGAMWRAIMASSQSSVEDVDSLFRRHADERVTGHIEASRLLSWDDLTVLRRHGVRIGNHTQRHLELDLLSREVVRREIREAQRLLREHLGTEEPVISYPRGKVNETVLHEASAAGYRWGFGTSPGIIAHPRPTLAAPRVLVGPTDGVAQLVWKASRLRFWARGRLKRRPRQPVPTP